MLKIIVPTCGIEGCFDEMLEGLAAYHIQYHGSLDNLMLAVVCNSDVGVNLNRVADALHRWRWRGLDYRLYEEPRRIGYVKAVDIGWKMCEAADDDYVVMTNDDMVIHGDWITPLMRVVDNKPGVLAGAAMKWLGSDGLRREIPRDGRNIGCYYAYIEGWCWMARGDTLRKAGGVVDLGFEGSYCEDCDLSIRVIESGGSIVQVDIPVTHVSHTTLKVTPEVQAMWDRNRRYLADKWDLVNGGPKKACIMG